MGNWECFEVRSDTRGCRVRSIDGIDGIVFQDGVMFHVKQFGRAGFDGYKGKRQKSWEHGKKRGQTDTTETLAVVE